VFVDTYDPPEPYRLLLQLLNDHGSIERVDFDEVMFGYFWLQKTKKGKKNIY
jgi:hypothetical protein